MRPNRSSVCATMASISPGSATFTVTPSACAPSASASSTAGGMVSAGTDATTTFAPACANARTQPRPIPPLPPVMMTVRPSMEKRDRSMNPP